MMMIREIVTNENDYSKIVSPSVEEEQSKEQNEESINNDASSNKTLSKMQKCEEQITTR